MAIPGRPRTDRSAANPASITRQIRTGDAVLIDIAGTKQLVSVTAYTELVWFANPQDVNHPDLPDPNAKVPIPIPHSQISFTPHLSAPN